MAPTPDEVDPLDQGDRDQGPCEFSEGYLDELASDDPDLFDALMDIEY